MTNRKIFNLTVVRHGQTVANREKTIQGQSDTPLTKLGIEQAKLLGQFFKSLANHTQFTRIYSSDQERALTTCRIVVAGTNLPESMIRKDDRLRERKYGKYEGSSIRCFISEACEHGYRESNFTQYTPDGVESMDQVIRRVRNFLQTLVNESKDNDEVLVVSHWATIKEFLKVFQPLSKGIIDKDHLVESPNAAFCKFRVECTPSGSHDNPDHFITGVRVICLHQTPHLRDGQTSINIQHPVD